eukprot:CAMPEP_0168572104 /NCGR_PEP_ID=MMETSP0413-20121227/17744_1 /TAXON_ID=136452 /ORGANISM="Filamoeba nolandi, Strain NC-AS-23-1" /LENGTH=47 /DNA_ID= /DNA_START= /DNA_END= /DNA_ORIENTATION=
MARRSAIPSFFKPLIAKFQSRISGAKEKANIGPIKGETNIAATTATE